MTVHLTPDALDLARFIRRGDRIVIGQACGEPPSLVEALIAQGAAIGDLSAFIATSFSGRFAPQGAGAFRLASMGAIGALRTMSKAHALDVVPVHVQVAQHLRQARAGQIPGISTRADDDPHRITGRGRGRLRVGHDTEHDSAV